ncbi:hypothetical protein BDZ89DRAFT_1071562 [Hymenopellis radicata]|nr:hypothetical protein BDZ89DRAFT_1071562 [Hymenopellis radicata]
MQVPPPLFGDGNGCYKIHISGNSGSGKTTLGRRLSVILGVPHIFLDTLFWEPGWKQTPDDEFQAKLRAAMDACPDGWVIDGDYVRRSGGLVQDNATDTIWLDPPLWFYFPRIVWRTFLRLLGATETCSPGCPERAKEVFFSKESIIWWCLSQHGINRRRNEERRKVLGDKMRRIGGTGSELERWIHDVELMSRNQ